MTVLTVELDKEDVGGRGYAVLRNGGINVSGLEFMVNVNTVSINAVTSRGNLATGFIRVPTNIMDEMVVQYIDARFGGGGDGVQLRHMLETCMIDECRAWLSDEQVELMAEKIIGKIRGAEDEQGKSNDGILSCGLGDNS